MCVTTATLIEVAMVNKPTVIRQAGRNPIMNYGMDFDWTHSSHFITACREFLHCMLSTFPGFASHDWHRVERSKVTCILSANGWHSTFIEESILKWYGSKYNVKKDQGCLKLESNLRQACWPNTPFWA